jgi:hypothetical protein
MIPTMIMSRSDAAMLAASSADRAAAGAMLLVSSPAAATRRSLMPVRSVIQASEVSTSFSRSKFVSTFAGVYRPVPRMRLPGAACVVMARTSGAPA